MAWQRIWHICEKASEIAALEANYNSMAENIREIKDTQKEILRKIDSLHDIFVTKEEHKSTKERIGEIDKIVSWMNTKIVFISGVFAVIVFVLEKWVK